MSTLVLTAVDNTDGLKQIAGNFFSCIPGMDRAAPVPVLYAATLDRGVFEKEWVARNRACLVKGAVRHWPAMEKWKDKEYWTSHCDNFEVNIYPHQNFISQERQKAGHEKMMFHSAIERLFENRDPVFSMPGEQVEKGGRFGKLEEDLPGFTFMPSPELPRWYERIRFFAYRRAATSWHYHGVDETLMCQVKGSKRVGLLSPRIPRLRQITQFLEEESYLDGQTLNPSLKLDPYIVDVEEGDALYIPPYWHHGVVPNDGEMGFTVACCWRSPMHILGDFSNFLVREIYRKGMWPFSPKTLILPFIGMYAGLLYYTKKAAGKI